MPRHHATDSAVRKYLAFVAAHAAGDHEGADEAAASLSLNVADACYLRAEALGLLVASGDAATLTEAGAEFLQGAATLGEVEEGQHLARNVAHRRWSKGDPEGIFHE